MKLLILLVIFILTAYSSYGQIRTDEINLKFTHWLRIPNHEIIIDVIYVIDRDTVLMHVQSNPMNDEPSWLHTKVDTTYRINKQQFKTLKETVQSISLEDMKKAMLGSGTDGTLCELGFGDRQNKVTFQVWTPDYDIKERGLEKYMEACEMMLKMAKFKPKKNILI